MNTDIIKATELITTQKQFSTDYNEHDRVYPYTTENLSGYMRDVQDKKALSVVGSGDHYLNLVSMGATHIDSFDINRFSIFYLKLKKAAVLALSKREFFEFLSTDASAYYPRVRKYLDAESLTFWDYYVRYFMFRCGIQNTFLFYPRYDGGDYIRRNPYMSEEGYLALKEKLPDHKDEKFFACDIYTLPYRISSQYDLIYFSNINNYQKNLLEYCRFASNLRNTHLKDGGSLYCGYFYRGSGGDYEVLQKQLVDYEIFEFPGVYRQGEEKDKVMILHK